MIALSTASVGPPVADTAASAALCAHCAEPLPATALQAGDASYCCTGCMAAAQWIADAELGDYYRLRQMPAGRVDTSAFNAAVWDREDVLAEHAHAIGAEREITVLTDGMRCAACAWLIGRALEREPGVSEASANAVTGRIRLRWDPVRTPLSRPLQRLAALGYVPFLAGGDAIERERRRERRRELLRLGIAGLGAMQAMMFAEALYLDTTASMPLPTRDFFRWLTFLVSTPIVFWAGWQFIAGALRELRARLPGMDTLVASSTLLAWAASAIETVRGGTHVWYDAAVMFVFLLLVARALERQARSTAAAQVDALARARPALAERETAHGDRETVPLSALVVGDVVRVAVGATVPADGALLDTDARFVEALLTGESQPIARRAGDTVLAGSVCAERAARLRVSHVGQATRLAELIRLVEHAQTQRPPLAQFAEKLASGFVLALLAAAVAVYTGWRTVEPDRAFEVVLALLVVSCPCALALAVPAALTAAHGALARIGVVVLRPQALQRLADVTDVVFDKTGTLTTDARACTDIATFGALGIDDARAIAAALERDSGHPLAAAFASDSRKTAASLRAYAGLGIEGIVNGRSWRLGRADFAAGRNDDGAVWLGDGDAAAARFEIDETLRDDAAPAVDALRALGLQLHLWSGDGASAVERVAQRLHIGAPRSRQSPERKLAQAHALQQRGRVVLMIGDGINDAPVLAGADVAIALGSGAALAHRAADCVLTAASLWRIPQAIALAQRTRSVIRQNLMWALLYNVLALPVAAAGLVTPWLAAMGMAVSSLLVTGNALRLAAIADSRVPAPDSRLRT